MKRLHINAAMLAFCLYILSTAGCSSSSEPVIPVIMNSPSVSQPVSDDIQVTPHTATPAPSSPAASPMLSSPVPSSPVPSIPVTSSPVLTPALSAAPVSFTQTPLPTVVFTAAPTSSPIPLPTRTAVSADDCPFYSYVNCYYVNVRSQPSTRAERVRRAYYGEKFLVTEVNGSWYTVLDEQGNSLYINGNYMDTNVFLFDINELTVVDCTKAQYTYTEMEQDLKELASKYPDSCSVYSIGSSLDGRAIYAATIGNPDAEKCILISAAIHGREYMTAQLVMKQMEYYLTYYNTGFYDDITYADYFQDICFVVIPMQNPDGVTISQLGLNGIQNKSLQKQILDCYTSDCENNNTTDNFDTYLTRWKANAAGVDLNRNFDYGWDVYEGRSTNSSERYKGSLPESEPESLSLANLTRTLKETKQLAAAISYHSSGSVLYWDIGQTGDFLTECLKLVKKTYQITDYTIIHAYDNDDVDDAGWGDWAAGALEIPSVTIEIGRVLSPINIREFMTIWGENREVWAAAASLYYNKNTQ